MIISQIVAVGKANQIGLNNKLLWHIPEDFKQFKKRTMGHHLLMGRKTFESIGRPLPGRVTIVVTSQKIVSDSEYVIYVPSIEDGIRYAQSQNESELFICGGESIYQQTLNISDKLYLTKVDYSGPADCYYPQIDLQNWQEDLSESHEARENSLSWTLSIFSRLK